MNILGIDEAGRGPVLGPMVIAGVFGDESYFEEESFPDSKELSKKERASLYQKIDDEADIMYLKIPATMIDECENLNLLEWRIMDSLMLYFDFDKVFLDAVGEKSEQINFFVNNSSLVDEDIVVENKADDIFDVVGASSIVAKEIRDRHIKELSKNYGDIGSGYPSDSKTRDWIKDNIDDLPDFVRTSWSTISKLKGD